MSNKDTTSKPSAEESRGSVLHPSEAERKLAAQIRAHISWANTEDRTQRTVNARAAFEQRFLDAAAGDPVKAAHLRKAFYLDIARKSAKARRKTGGDGDVAA